MGFLIHEFSVLYFTLKAHKSPPAGAAISGHAFHVSKAALYYASLWDLASIETKPPPDAMNMSAYDDTLRNSLFGIF